MILAMPFSPAAAILVMPIFSAVIGALAFGDRLAGRRAGVCGVAGRAAYGTRLALPRQ